VRPVRPVAVVAWALVEPLALRHGDGASRDVGRLRGGRLWVRRAGMSGRGNSERDDRTAGEGEGEGWTSFCITAPRADAKAGRVGDTPALWVLQKLEAAKLEVRSCPSKHDAGALRPVAALMRGRGRAEGLDRPPGRWR
jgi:hypothetical protein